MSVTDPGNENKDISVYIEPPPVMNINENLKQSRQVELVNPVWRFFYHCYMVSSEEGEIKIDVDPNKTSWIGS